MIEFVKETLLLFPFLFATYLALEALEAKAGGALGRFLERTRSVGPLAGALAGAVPQCGFSAAAASFYAGGVISLGTLLAVFLSTSDELLVVLMTSGIGMDILAKIVIIKIVAAIVIGFLVNSLARKMFSPRREVKVAELCEHSHCSCHHHHGIFYPALIHTMEIFFFIVLVSALIELSVHCFGEESLQKLCFNVPVLGEMMAGALGLIPNCCVSAAAAEMYSQGAMSASAMMAGSFTGSGLGLLVLFRTNRSLKENLVILALVYVIGVALGFITGSLI